MASAKVLSGGAIAVDASFDDLTTKTGGNSRTVGYNRASWLLDNTQVSGRRKASAPEDIVTSYFGGGLSQFGGQVHRTKVFEAFDAVDVDGIEVSGAYSSTNAMLTQFAQAQIDTGITYLMPADQYLRRFTWPGALVQGTYVVTATLADGSNGPLSFSLGAVTSKTDKWFQITWRTLADTTITVEIRKTVAGASSSQIWSQGGVIEVPTAPTRARSAYNLLTHRANRR